MRARVVIATLLFTTPAQALPVPRLVPDLTFSRDKGADAAPLPDTWSSRKKALQLQGGGGPVGALGMSFEYAPIKYVVLAAGGGLSPEGLRGALMPRLRLPLLPWFALGFGVPFSTGPYEYTSQELERCQVVGCAVGFRTTRTWNWAAWAHVEPSIELRYDGWSARLFGGLSQVLNPESDRCVSTLPHGCPSNVGERRIYGGLALGYAW